MIYVFGILLILSFIKQKDILTKTKKNLILFIVLSLCGITLGVVHMVSPYIPSIAFALENHLK